MKKSTFDLTNKEQKEIYKKIKNKPFFKDLKGRFILNYIFIFLAFCILPCYTLVTELHVIEELPQDLKNLLIESFIINTLPIFGLVCFVAYSITVIIYQNKKQDAIFKYYEENNE